MRVSIAWLLGHPCFHSALAAGQETDPAGLENLHDIVMPHAVSWWPPAPGWYVLFFLVFLFSLWFAWRGYRRRRAGAYRRAALNLLAGLRSRVGKVDERIIALRELPELLKRTALAAWPRARIAGLSGDEWLAFLDSTGGTRDFTEGDGRLLSTLAYAGDGELEAVNEDQAASMISVMEGWIKNHCVSEESNV